MSKVLYILLFLCLFSDVIVGQTTPPVVITMPTSGAVDAIVFPTAETGSSDFGFRYTTVPGSNGETRRDNILTYGYNPSGVTSGEPNVQLTMENRYRTSQGINQSEVYFAAGMQGMGGSRPFSFNLYHDTSQTEVFISTSSFKVSDANQSNNWLSFNSTPTSGDVLLKNNSGIFYDGSRDWVINDHGTGLLSRHITGTFGGASGGVEVGHGVYELNFGKASNPTTNDFFLTMGGAQYITGLRFDHVAQKMGYMVGVTSVSSPSPTWRSFDSLEFIGTPGSIPFIGANNKLSEDNTGLSFDSAGDKLKLTGSEDTYVQITSPLNKEGGLIFRDVTNGNDMWLIRKRNTRDLAVYSSSQSGFVWSLGSDGKMSVYDGAVLQPVTVGAPDSCGAGFRCLKIPN